MGSRLIRDEQELLRWHAEGRTYEWMRQEYRRKYGLAVSQTMFANWRQRRGLPRRIVRDDELIPWAIRSEHQHDYRVAMLRAEGRRRAGAPLRTSAAERLEPWLAGLAERGEVVAYDPACGFSCVPREAGDVDIVRVPVKLQHRTRRRRRD